MGGIRDIVTTGPSIGVMNTPTIDGATPMSTGPRYAAVTATNGHVLAYINLDRARMLPIVGGGEGDEPPTPPAPPTPPVASVSQADLDRAVAAAAETARAEAIRALGFDNPADAEAAVKAYKELQDAQRTDTERAQAAAAEAAAEAATYRAQVEQYQRRDTIAAAIGDARFIPNVEAAIVGELNDTTLQAAVDHVRTMFPGEFPAVDENGHLVQPPPPAIPNRPVGVAGTGGVIRPAPVPGPKPADRLKAGADKFATSHPDRVKQTA